MVKTDFKTIDQYIATFPKDVQASLERIRQTIQKAVPEATEVISYQMPTFIYHGYLVYFAAFTNHYSLFIPPAGVYEAFAKELTGYKMSKATLQFQKAEPVPYTLIAKLVKFAAKQNLNRELQEK